MNYTDSDIQAIVDTKTELLQKEIELKNTEYQILLKTSDQIEEEQRREIYELKQKIDKAKRILEANTNVENIYSALCNLFEAGDFEFEFNDEELNKILKEEK